MTKMIAVKPMECAGCKTCEMACSLSHHDMCSPLLSNMRVLEWPSLGLTVPMTCLQCEDPVCLKACAVNAIKRDEATGATVVDEKICVGCKMCTMVCPAGAPTININTRKAIKCDLCGGDPLCVKMCPTHAIEFVEVNDFTLEKKKNGAEYLVANELIKLKEYNKGLGSK